MNILARFLPTLLITTAIAMAQSPDRFPFVIPGDDATPSPTDMSGLLHAPAGKDGFVTIRDNHFYTGDRRLRIWGVNTCFAANFPTHAEAGKVAAHLAKLGVNGVRMHHHDWFDNPRGLWKEGTVVDSRRVFDPEMLDRQDFFLAQLHENGIYADLNLHVSRTFTTAEGFVDEGMPEATRFNKYILYFEPRMRARFKEFCRDYLLHENPYRRLRRVDDPGIAVLEITNENAFSQTGFDVAAALPEPYRSEFKRQWNAWLKDRYRTTAALRRAWRQQEEPLGDDIAPMGDLGAELGPWHLRQGKPVEAVFARPGPSADLPALKLDILEPDAVYMQELTLGDLTLAEDALYTLSFWVRADSARTLFVDISNQGPDDWRPLGYGETIRVTPEWQKVERTFRASESSDANARICFKFGGTEVDLYLSDVRLRTGGSQIVLPEAQSLEEADVEIPVQGWVTGAKRDLHTFMVETEKEFIRDITAYLKEELGVKVPITASQITYHGAEIVAQTCDYADIHGYWQHPRFPHTPWDREDWFIDNTPMERAPGRDTMLGRTPWRLVDRPFTMSEWNIPDPGDYSASVVPFAAMVAALQDWDGIFFFQYHSSEGEWFRDRVDNYFSFNGQPVKLALLTAFANLYLRGDLPPLSDELTGTLTDRLPAGLGIGHRIGIDPKAAQPADYHPPAENRLASPDEKVVWDATDPDRAYLRVSTPATRAVWGLIAGQTFDLDGLTIAVGPVERDYAAVILTSLDGKPLEKTEKILLTAVGSAENLDMGWNAERTSVGAEWGTGPTQVNGIPLDIALKGKFRKLRVLDGRGQPISTLKTRVDHGITHVEAGPEQRTLWYLLEH